MTLLINDCFFNKRLLLRVLLTCVISGAEPPPASLGTSPGSASTFFVASLAITRTSCFSCGFWCKFRRKRFPTDIAKDLGSQINVIPSWVIVSLGF